MWRGVECLSILVVVMLMAHVSLGLATPPIRLYGAKTYVFRGRW